MPSHRKQLVQARMEKTGESYQQALRHLRSQEERPATPSRERVARSRVVADTAFSIAVIRAAERDLPAPERLFDDPCAALFAAAGGHAQESTQRFLDLPFFRDGIRLRTRFIDDAVRAGVDAGLDQLVILGAGFDMRGVRLPEVAAKRATVFEVDTAEQLARKRKILAADRAVVWSSPTARARSTPTPPRRASARRASTAATSSAATRCGLATWAASLIRTPS